MSDMVKRWEESSKPRVKEARQIPSLATNYFDPMSEFAEGFTPNVKKGQGLFTETAQQHYNAEVKGIIIPDGFQPTEQGITLNRWTPEKKYYNPGQK